MLGCGDGGESVVGHRAWRGGGGGHWPQAHALMLQSVQLCACSILLPQTCPHTQAHALAADAWSLYAGCLDCTIRAWHFVERPSS